MLQAEFVEGLVLDILSHFQGCRASTVIEAYRGKVAQVLLITIAVVVFNGGAGLPIDVTGQEVFFVENAVLQRLVPAFDLAPCLRIMRRTTHVFHTLVIEIVTRIACSIRRAIVAE